MTQTKRRIASVLVIIFNILALGALVSCAPGNQGVDQKPVLATVSPTLTLTNVPLQTLTFTPTVTPVQTPTSISTFTPTAPATPALRIGSTQISEKDGMVMMAVPGGEFLMGSADSDSNAFTQEKPQHIVNLNNFWIDRTEVTNVMYALCVKEGICHVPSSTRSFLRDSYYGNPQFSNYPVIYVSWQDADTYCKWINKRLPTESEWEKAARGLDERIYPWGNALPDSNLLNYDRQIRDTTEVGKYPEGMSPYGVLDMAGNVWEWVADWHDAKYYTISPMNNPIGPSTGTNRVLRSGSWIDGARGVRAAVRSWFAPGFGDGNVGFRCVR